MLLPGATSQEPATLDPKLAIEAEPPAAFSYFVAPVTPAEEDFVLAEPDTLFVQDLEPLVAGDLELVAPPGLRKLGKPNQ